MSIETGSMPSVVPVWNNYRDFEGGWLAPGRKISGFGAISLKNSA